MKIAFWVSACFILYTYIGYPCLIFIGSRFFPKKVNKFAISPEPMVSVIISSRNEETQIQKRIINLLEQDYPAGKMEIIIVSDGSTDATADVVRRFVEGSHKPLRAELSEVAAIRLIELLESKGKANALNIAVLEAKGDYLVFTDSRQAFGPNAIKELVANFSDPEVGCVSGELLFYENCATQIKAEMGFYWDLEKRIRKMESEFNSVPGATGAIYAIRKALFRQIPEGTLLDDVFVPMMVVFQGYRTIFDSQAVAYDVVSNNLSEEKARKVRTLLGNYQLLAIIPQLLSPVKNRIFLTYVSHKVFRLFVPFFFIAFVLSSLMIKEFTYNAIFIITIFFLLLPAFDRFLSPIKYIQNVNKMLRTFMYLNYFALLAFFSLFRRRKNVW
jgi:poly-beta-1,6-N-acetyl-D-glucosamine synthase